MSPRYLLLASTAVAFVLSAAPANAQSAAPRLEVELNGSADALGGEFGLFAPADIGDGTIAYGSVYAGILPGAGEFYGSVGAGVRTRLDADFVLGGNLHYDALGSGNGNAYQQISAGLELLSRHYEFRLEGNLPVGTTSNIEDDLTSVGIEDDALAIRQGYEVALYGLRAEAGFRLPVFEDDSGRSLKLFAELFTRGGELIAPVHGLGVRAELQLADIEQWPGANLTFGAGLSHDTSGQTGAQAFFRLSAPLGGGNSTPADLDDPLYASPRHTARIATLAGAFGASQAASYLDGRTTGTVQRIDAATGDAAAINAAIAAAGEDALLLVNGEIELDDTIYLAMGQTLFGGGSTLEIVAQGTGKHYTIANGGSRGHLVAVPSVGTMSLFASTPVAVVELADRTTVASVDISGGDFGISGEGVSDIVLTDVNIANTASHGIRLVDVDGAAISGITYTSVDGCNGCSSMSYSNVYDTVTQAAFYGVGLRNATIEGFDVDGAGWGLVFAGLTSGGTITSATSDITVTDVTIRNTSEESLLFYLAENIEVSDFEIDNRGRADTEVHDSVVFMSARDISLTNGVARGGINGLMFVDPEPLPYSVGNITIADVEVSDTYRAGIFLNPVNGVTFRNVDIVRPASESWATAIFLYGGFTSSEAIENILFDNVSVIDVVDPGSSGINLVGYQTNLSGSITIENAATVCNDWGATVTGSTLLINNDTIANVC